MGVEELGNETSSYLAIGHLDSENPFTLGRQLFDDVSFETTQHDRLQFSVKVSNLALVLFV